MVGEALPRIPNNTADVPNTPEAPGVSDHTVEHRKRHLRSLSVDIHAGAPPKALKRASRFVHLGLIAMWGKLSSTRSGGQAPSAGQAPGADFIPSVARYF